MAYAKIIATSIDPAKVAFTYTTNSIFDNVSLQSTYMTKDMATKDGVSLGENYALSADEREAFDVILDTVMSDIYEIFLKQTSGVSNAFTLSTTEVKVIILDNAAYNENVLKIVDMALYDCITTGCLKGWFESCSHIDLHKQVYAKYVMVKEQLRRRLFQLKKKRAI